MIRRGGGARSCACWRIHASEKFICERGWLRRHAIAEWRQRFQEDVAVENDFWAQRRAQRVVDRADSWHARKALAMAQCELGSALTFDDNDPWWNDVFLSSDYTTEEEDDNEE